MKLIVYPMTQLDLPLRPAPAKRDWMDATPEAYAYRCLPLNIANAHGWEVLNMRSFSAIWDGGVSPESIAITFDESEVIPPGAHIKPPAHFGSAVLTFELPMMFRTPPGWNMWVMGPVNRPKHGAQPLSGIIETDWSPYTFTMNWIVTRPGEAVRFEKGEPIAHILPIKRGQIERFDAEIRDMAEDRDLMEQNTLWRESRSGFIASLSAREQEAVKQKWQKAYFRGERPDGKTGVRDHQTKVRVAEFVRPSKAARSARNKKPRR
jgi:antitoxin (DNA-binding transcriptional repressor) of toxin-antitoxin stability system